MAIVDLRVDYSDIQVNEDSLALIAAITTVDHPTGWTIARDADEDISRYIVSVASLAQEPVDKPITVADWRIIVDRYLALAKELPALTLGYWLDNGIAYVDANLSYPSLQYAILVAAQRGEIAIYDTVDHCDIVVKDYLSSYDYQLPYWRQNDEHTVITRIFPSGYWLVSFYRSNGNKVAQWQYDNLESAIAAFLCESPVKYVDEVLS